MVTRHVAAIGAAAPLDAVAAARRLAEVVEGALREAVERARHAGHTWQELGLTLGTSRQAAFQRFGHPLDPRTGTPMAPPRDEFVEPAVALFGRLAARRWREARRDFGPGVAERLSADALAGVWAQVAGLVGAYEGTGEPNAFRAGDHTVVDVPLRFEAGERIGRVTFDDDGRIAGLWFLPAASGRRTETGHTSEGRTGEGRTGKGHSREGRTGKGHSRERRTGRGGAS